jgi:dolichol-phosphate mannosyltransferase
MVFYIFYIALFTDKAIAGWTSTIVSIYFLGGIQLLSLGIIGEYLGKVFTESKKRPNYLVEEKLE